MSRHFTPPSTLVRHPVIALELEQRTIKATIADMEAALNEQLYGLYKLTDAERRMIEQI